MSVGVGAAERSVEAGADGSGETDAAAAVLDGGPDAPTDGAGDATLGVGVAEEQPLNRRMEMADDRARPMGELTGLGRPMHASV